MIPKIIHYCWFGRGEMPELALKCIVSWHKYMPDWEYKLWNEDNFDVNSVPYVKEAYEARKFAFVSDYVRLFALYNEGGLYLDTDVEVLKPFDELMTYSAFVGFEGSKHLPIGTCVMASAPQSLWVKEQLESYEGIHFIQSNGSYDMKTNVVRITDNLTKNGLVCNGLEQDCGELHIFPVDYFSPRLTTGEYLRTEHTYSDHLAVGSWANKQKPFWMKIAGPEMSIRLIKLKRHLFG